MQNNFLKKKKKNQINKNQFNKQHQFTKFIVQVLNKYDMERPVTLIRNKYKRTPLERIEESISKAQKDLKTEEEKFKSSTGEIWDIISDKYKDLQKTIDLLKEERKKREVKVQRLNKQRKTLINKLIFARGQNNKNLSKNLVKKIIIIDDELGPFGNSNVQVYLD